MHLQNWMYFNNRWFILIKFEFPWFRSRYPRWHPKKVEWRGGKFSASSYLKFKNTNFFILIENIVNDRRTDKNFDFCENSRFPIFYILEWPKKLIYYQNLKKSFREKPVLSFRGLLRSIYNYIYMYNINI